MGADERPDGGLDLFLLRVGVGLVAEEQARVQRVVLGLEALQVALGALVERVVGGAQVREFGVAAPARKGPEASRRPDSKSLLIISNRSTHL